jgi:hypothetical protein
MGQTRDIRNGKGTSEMGTYTPGEYHEERSDDHEGAEGDLLLPGSPSRDQQRDAVDRGEQEAGDEGCPASPGQHGSQARCGLDVFPELTCAS